MHAHPKLDHTRLSIYAAFLAVALLLGGCGGSNEAQSGSGAGGGGSDDGAAANDAAGDSSDGDPAVPFDAGALGNGSLNAVHVQPLNRSGPTPPPQVTPVIDTCAALASSDFDVIVNEIATEFSFGEDPRFVATSLGAACDYRSDTHLIRVLVGPSEQVGTTPDSPGLSLPIGAGVVSEMVSPEDGAVSILSEDSIGFVTPFAAFTSSGSYGVMVSNIGGTGIDYGSTGLLFSRVASTVSAQVSAAPAPSEQAVEGMENVAADPCSVWTVAELDAFLVDMSIERAEDGNITDGCRWSSEATLDQITLEAFLPGAATEGYQPITDGSSVLVKPGTDRVFIVTGEIVLRIQVSKETVGSVFYDGTDAGVALAENILSRLG